jgi:uncharacterized protein DUF4129
VAGESVAVAGGQSAEAKFAAAHQALLKTRGLQFDFAAMKPDKPPPWLEPLLKFLTAIGPALKYVFFGGLIVGAAFVLYFLLREFIPERWFRRKTQVAVTDWRPEPEKARALLDDADRLAATGQFEEAIHLLLFRSIDDLVARRPGAVKPALTSRDIAGLEVLPASARAAFARLAQAVERTFFGGRPAGADEFGAARADYEAFAFAEGWR